MRRVTPDEARALADLFRRGKLLQPIDLTVDQVTFTVAVIAEPFDEFEGQMVYRRMTAPDGTDGVRVNDRPGWLDLMVGQWSDQPDNEQIVLSSGRKELDERFGQINLDLSLTDGRTVYLVKSLSKEGGAGAITRLYGGARGREMAGERSMRREQLVAGLGNETITFEEEEWLVIAVLPLRISRWRANALFTEAMVQFLRYAAQVERLRLGAESQDEPHEEGQRTVGLPRRLSAAERKLIELEAMAVVRAHLEAQGYRVKDVASRESYDFEVRFEQQVRYIEVKGTTTRPWSVELTAPEHRVASREQDRYSLYVVLFEDLNHLDRFELVKVGNPIASSACAVSPIRYRVQGR